MAARIWTEFPSSAPGASSLITIGPVNADGTRFGMALDPARPLSEMAQWCCGPDPNRDPTDYATYHGDRIRSSLDATGRVGIDLSGHCLARCILDANGINTVMNEKGELVQVSQPGDKDGAAHYVEAIERTIQASGREPDENWLFWSNSETGDAGDTTFRFFRGLWDTGITRRARLCVTNMVGGRTPKRLFRTSPRAIDDRCSEVPGWFGEPWGETDDDCIDFTMRILADVKRAGLAPVLHCCGVGYDGHGKRVSDERKANQLRLIEYAVAAGVEDYLIFNSAGNIGERDVFAAQASEAETVAAVVGSAATAVE